MEEKQMSNDKSENSRGKRKLNPADNSRKQFNSNNHSFQKRPTAKPFQRKNDIYVSNKTNFKVKVLCTTTHHTHSSSTDLFLLYLFQVQMKQCQDLLKSEEVDEIYLHCLGNAIKRGITLALTLVQESNNGLGYEANTSSIDLIGEFFFLIEIILYVFCVCFPI